MEIAGYSIKGLTAMLKAIVSRRKPIADSDSLAHQPILPSILILCGLLCLSVARAQTVAPTPDTNPTFNDSYDLISLGEKQPLVMRGASATSQVLFRIPLTKVVTGAHLDLRYRVSPNLMPAVSQLHVILNGTPVAAIPVAPNKANPELPIEAPESSCRPIC